MVRSKKQQFDVRDEELFWELDEGLPSDPSPSQAWSPPAVEPVPLEIAPGAAPDPSSSLLPDEDPAPAAPQVGDVATINQGHVRALAVLALVGAVGAALMVSDFAGLVIEQLRGGGPEPTAEAHARRAETEPRKQQASVLASRLPESADREVPGAAAAKRERLAQARERRNRTKARAAARKPGKRAERKAARPAAPIPPVQSTPVAPAPAPTPAPTPRAPAPAPTSEFGFEQ